MFVPVPYDNTFGDHAHYDEQDSCGTKVPYKNSQSGRTVYSSCNNWTTIAIIEIEIEIEIEPLKRIALQILPVVVVIGRFLISEAMKK